MSPLAWQEQGLCAETDPELFFPPPGTGLATIRNAQRICYECPVIFECREWAIENRELIGIWGGTTPNERRAIIRIRGRAG